MIANRPPYFIQVGFDFGTAFSKCIYRDVGANRAYVYQPELSFNAQLPFLLPVLLEHRDKKLVNPDQANGFHHQNHLSLLKMALFNITSGRGDDITVQRCKKVFKCKAKLLRKRIEAATTYYLACKFSEIQDKIYSQFKGFGDNVNDSVFLNVAIPVAHASSPEIHKAFERVINTAWNDNKKITECDGDLGLIAQRINIAGDKLNSLDDCYLYPEVSANVQAYVRSRTSQPGIYLFVDTGAGTVDQSVFILNQTGKLAYLSAQVSPLGSSQIETRAFEKCNRTIDLDLLRQKKEAGSFEGGPMKYAADSIIEELKSPTHMGLGITYKKGILTNQIKNLRIIYGGGGHLDNPYGQGIRGGVNDFFTHRDLGGGFNSDGYTAPFNADDIPDMGIPIPNDLEIPKNSRSNQWFKRLSVAYGLSFPRYDLTDFKFPHEIHDFVPIKRTRLVGNEYIEN